MLCLLYRLDHDDFRTCLFLLLFYHDFRHVSGIDETLALVSLTHGNILTQISVCWHELLRV